MKRSGIPERNQLVVCRILKIHPNSAIVELIEYEGLTGLVHVSEVANRWVKNITEFLREGQYVVCRVMDVDRSSIGLSIKRVREGEATSKLNEWKKELKAEKMLELVAKKMGKDMESAYNEVGHALQDTFGSVFKAFEISTKNPEILKAKGIPEEWVKAISEIASKTFSDKTFEVKGVLNLVSYRPDGVEFIKKTLMERTKGTGIEVKYISAPRYSLSIKGKNFKEIRSSLERVGEEIAKEVSKNSGEGSFQITEN